MWGAGWSGWTEAIIFGISFFIRKNVGWRSEPVAEDSSASFDFFLKAEINKKNYIKVIALYIYIYINMVLWDFQVQIKMKIFDA